jgi:hypothetical protein
MELKLFKAILIDRFAGKNNAQYLTFASTEGTVKVADKTGVFGNTPQSEPLGDLVIQVKGGQYGLEARSVSKAK